MQQRRQQLRDLHRKYDRPGAGEDGSRSPPGWPRCWRVQEALAAELERLDRPPAASGSRRCVGARDGRPPRWPRPRPAPRRLLAGPPVGRRSRLAAATGDLLAQPAMPGCGSTSRSRGPRRSGTGTCGARTGHVPPRRQPGRAAAAACRRWPPAASCPGSCWRCAWPSTAAGPASGPRAPRAAAGRGRGSDGPATMIFDEVDAGIGGRPPRRWARRWPAWPPTARCWSSPTWRRSRPGATPRSRHQAPGGGRDVVAGEGAGGRRAGRRAGPHAVGVPRIGQCPPNTRRSCWPQDAAVTGARPIDGSPDAVG